jgi:AcrR family transcriptional regulator
MRSNRQPVGQIRKMPAQERSQETVKIIFEAAARILERDGRAAFNTNAVAELAGISIGTLYHYFQSKEAILVAMARGEMQAHQTAVVQTLARNLEEPQAVRAIVRALIDAFGQRLRSRQIAIDTVIAHGLAAELAAPVQAISNVLEADGVLPRLGVSRPISAMTLFVLTRAMSGVLSAAMREGLPPAARRELEDELVRLTEAYLGIPQSPPGPPRC